MAEFALRRTSGEGWTYTVEPKGSFKEYGERKFNGDGSVTEIGYAEAVWDYGDRPLTGTEMYELLQFIGSVQVRTKTNEVNSSGYPVFRIYQAIMIRPDVEFDTQHGQQRFVNVSITFKCSEELSS